MCLRFPLVITFIIFNSSFIAGQQISAPVLVSEPTSTRAIALESPTFTAQPFRPTSALRWNGDGRTRIMLFVLGLTLGPGENETALTGEAEDGAGQHYTLTVEDYHKPVGKEWLAQIVLRLSDNMTDPGDCLIRIYYHNVPSNRVRVAIGHFGNGPPDDPGALPTPAPPYIISGRVTVDGNGMAGATVTLGGPESASTTTDSQGLYSLTVNSVANYTVTPSFGAFVFSPAVKTFATVLGNRNADFATTTANITGIVKDELGNLRSSATVTLSGAILTTTITAADGSFSFTQIPALQTYTVKPEDSAILGYVPQSIASLNGDASLIFTAARRLYTISGNATNGFGQGISGARVKLTGAMQRESLTDTSGHYVFFNIPAGYIYYVTVTADRFIFNPSTLYIGGLLTDRTVDFQGTASFNITGRITDLNGSPVFGVNMRLGGSQTSTTTTDANGRYVFPVLPGSYTVTPSFPQFFYSFSPTSRSVSVTTDRVVDFTGRFSPLTAPATVLEFDGTPMNVDHGDFWPPRVDLGNFFWELWAMPGDNNYTRYLLSDGYGGAHALLFGFNYSEPGHYNLFGNIWKGDGTGVSFASVEGPAANEWGHFAVGWDGNNVITYFDGVPVGKMPFTGPRQTLSGDSGSGHLFIGGSDHQNTIGRIAQARGYENSNPRASAPESTFTPDTLFSRDGSFVAYYLRPSPSIGDLTRIGYTGLPHHGILRGMRLGFGDPCVGCPVPTFVQDPTAPNFIDPNNPGQTTTTVNAPPPAPLGAYVFDSFTRNNSTYILNGRGGLATTEGGSAGNLSWQTSTAAGGRNSFGILSGRAVLLADTKAIAWVNVSTPNQDIRVNRGAGFWGSGTDTGIAFRVSDENNHFFAYTNYAQSGIQNLVVGYYLNGSRVELSTTGGLPSSWATLRVVTMDNGHIMVYVDNTPLYSTTISLLANASGAGLYNNQGGMALMNRWDNFTVLRATP